MNQKHTKEKGMIIGVGSIKGGVGKSTLALNLTTYLINKGFSCALVECDPQRTSDTFIELRVMKEISPSIHTFTKLGRTTETLELLAETYDFVIADCAGHNSPELISTLFAADVLLSPISSCPLELRSLVDLAKVVNEAMIRNPKIKSFMVLNRIHHYGTKSEAKKVQEYLSLDALDKLVALDSVIMDRNIYKVVHSEALTVSDIDSTSTWLKVPQRLAATKALEDIDAVWTETVQRLLGTYQPVNQAHEEIEAV